MIWLHLSYRIDLLVQFILLIFKDSILFSPKCLKKWLMGLFRGQFFKHLIFSRRNPFELMTVGGISGTIISIWNQLTFTNIPYASVQNYHYLWLKYNNLVSGDFAIYCLPIVREVFNRKTDYFMTLSQLWHFNL